MARRVTIQDIADELGLSRNTVSKAINNSEGIAEGTRTLVIQKAMEMGYKQFAFANSIRALQAGEPMRAPSDPSEIALLTTGYLAGPHFATLMLDAFQNEVSQLGYTLNTHRVTSVHLAERKLPITFRRERVAAIICIEMFDRAYDEMICELGLPILFIDCPPKTGGWAPHADQLYMDNYVGITKLVSDVVASGRTRVGFIGNYDHCQSFYERYSAFRLAMIDAGLEVDERFIIKSNLREEIAALLATVGELPDLYLCANDFVAIDALQVIRELGHHVPDDVWLAGFDDAAESRTCMPPLTTVHIHTQIMAYAALELLRSRLKEPWLDFRRVYTETELIYRESTPLA